MRCFNLLLVVVCFTLVACSDSLPPVAGDTGGQIDVGTADGPSIADRGMADGPAVRDTSTGDGQPVSDTGTADGTVDQGSSDTSVDTVAPPTTCAFDDPNSLFDSCLFGP